MKLYLAGHQGLYSEPNTDIVLTSSQVTGVSEGVRRPVGFALSLQPTLATGLVGIRLSAPAGSRPGLLVIDHGGRLAARINVPESGQPIVWRPLDRDGRRLAAGSYLVVLQGNGGRLVRKLVLR